MFDRLVYSTSHACRYHAWEVDQAKRTRDKTCSNPRLVEGMVLVKVIEECLIKESVIGS